MTKVSRAMLSLVVTLVMTLAMAGPSPAWAAPKKDAKAAKTTPAAPGAHKINACGCYQDAAGVCFCSKKAKGKCVCPGECEPKGCEEKRAKDIEREIKTETKRAQDSERKQKMATKSKSAAGGAADGDDRGDEKDRKTTGKKEAKEVGKEAGRQ